MRNQKDESRVDDTQYGAPLATASENKQAPTQNMCACVSDDAERCIALRYPDEAASLAEWTDEPERCECSCHDFAGYDE